MRSLFILFLFFSWALIPSCSKTDTNNPNTLSQTIKLHGMVVDQDMKPVSGATVSFNGKTSSSDGGFYVINNAVISSGRQIVKASLSGYFDAVVGFEATSSTSSQVKITLVKKSLTGTLQASTGGTISNGAAEVTLPSNALVTSSGSAFAGTANLYTHVFNPGDANFSQMTPGGDLNAKNASGEEKQLLSLGMIAVKIEDGAGKELKVASGKTATIKLAIDAGQLANAPATIKLWHLNESNGIWEEEGTATKQGNFYVGTVTHFSTWNVDQEANVARIKGVIVDCNGEFVAVADASISDATPGSGNRPQNSIQLENQGKFTVRVAAGFPLTLNVYPYGDRTNPKTISIPSLSPGQIYDAGTISVPCGAKVSGRLVDCNGNLVSGMVRIESGITGMTVDIPNGILNLSLGSNKTYTITPYCLANVLFGNPITITTGASNSVIDKGDIPTCACNGTPTNIDITNSYFTVNGGSFSNEQFKFGAGTGSPIAILVPEDTMYNVTASGTKLSTGETMSMIAQFVGVNTGTYIIDEDNLFQGRGQVILSVNATDPSNAKIFVAKSGTISVTAVSTSGQPVNLSFNGTFEYTGDGGATVETVSISGVLQAKRFQ